MNDHNNTLKVGHVDEDIVLVLYKFKFKKCIL